jgi:hypothetical protein
LAAAFGDEPSFEARDIALGVRLDLVDPHVVDDHAIWGKIDEFPRAVVYERGVLLLHSSLPFRCLVARESNPMRFRLNTVSGGKESNGMRGCARRDVMWTVINARRDIRRCPL